MDFITRLKAERNGKVHGGIYDITQKRFAYNSNKIEGSRLTEEQTSFIYETKTIANIGGTGIKIDDLVETTNHFKCFDYILDTVNEPLTEDYIKKLHSLLKSGTSSEHNPIAPVGRYKVLQNEVGQIATADVDRTEDEMLALIIGYGLKENKDLAYLTSFHAQFEQIHPFADGNGRVGRLILYKECLKEGITPFIVDDLNKASYYSALEAFQINDERQPLLDYFRSEQKFYANYLKNKGFEGKINEAKDGDVIKKPEGFSEKLERLKKETQGTTKKVAPSKEEDLSL
ncbi:Fic family protein [Streptococcus sp. FSL L8-0526]|uniref:Fic family protein n=1 Tax=Streptococcus sp. FSL L8-0526 TaxID=2954690 RepID=UPI0030FCF742